MGEATPVGDDGVITAEEARKRLGVSKNKMAEWLHYGKLPSGPSEFDRRVKLVRVQDVERLQREREAQRKREGRGA